MSFLAGFLAISAVLGLYNWRILVPLLLVYMTIDGFVSNLFWPSTFALLSKDILAFVLYSSLAVHAFIGRLGPGPKPFGRLFLSLALLVGVSVVEIFNPLLPSVVVGFIGVRSTLFYLPMILVGYYYVRNRHDLRRVQNILIWTAVPVSLFAVFQFLVGPEFLIMLSPAFERSVYGYFVARDPGAYSGFRAFSTFASPGQLATFLLIILNLGILRLHWLESMGGRIRGTLLLLLFSVGLLTTASRGALISLALQIAIIFWQGYGGVRALGGIALVGAMVTSALGLVGTLAPAMWQRVGSLDVGLAVHRFLWSFLRPFLETLDRYPLGIGLGSASVAARYVTGKSGGVVPLVESQPVKMVYEVGIIGLVAFYWVMAEIILLAWRVGRASEERDSRWFGYGMFAFYLTTTLLSAVGVMDTPPLNLIMWLTVGMTLRLGMAVLEERRSVMGRRVPATVGA